MPERINMAKRVDPLIAELERLRECSQSAMTAFKAIEKRLAELERQIQISRKDNSEKGGTPPGRKR